MFFNAFYVQHDSSKKIVSESCFSYDIGKTYFEVKRWKSIRVIHYIWENSKLEKKIDIFRDVNAIVLQHEIDHLKGITIFS
jgi:peptide deformylase